MDEGSSDAGEPMPTASGSAAAAELRRQQAAAELVAEAPLAEERRDNAMRLKDAGNAAVREGDFVRARKKYDKAMVYLCISMDELRLGRFSEDQLAQLSSLRGTIHLNRALVNIKEGKWAEALWDCDEGLKEHPRDLKGLFRRATVLEHDAVHSLAAHTDRREYWDPDRVAADIQRGLDDLQLAASLAPPADEAVARALARLQRLQARCTACVRRAESRQTTELAGRLRGALGAGASSSTSSQVDPHGVDDDMPGLEDP